MQCTGTIQNINYDTVTDTTLVTFVVSNENASNFEEMLNNEKLSIEVKKIKNKRSLDANAYAWVLIGKLAEKMKMKSVDVYQKEIRELGICEIIPIKNEALKRFKEQWQSNGIGYICEEFPSKLDGYTNVRAYYGSSSFDTAEMSRLIDGIVQECKEQGIETMTPFELEMLKMGWK